MPCWVFSAHGNFSHEPLIVISVEDFLSSFMGEQSIPVSPKLAGGYKAVEEVSKSPESFGEIETNNIEKGNTAGGQTERKRKRRRFYDTKDENGNWLIPHVPLPRIPKSDIRREYAQLFTNVYNSGDNDLLRRFVAQMFPDSHSFRFGYGGTARRDLMFYPAFFVIERCMLLYRQILRVMHGTSCAVSIFPGAYVDGT